MAEESTTPDLALSRELSETANQMDFDKYMSYFAPDAIWDASRIGMGVGVIEGVAKIRRLLDDFYRRFEDAKIEPTELHDLGSGVIFAVSTHTGRIAGGEGVIAERAAQIYEWVDGLVVRVIDYRDPTEARAAAERLAKVRG
jgi:ketosteroid isomerase-like protein